MSRAPKTARGKRALEDRKGKIVENEKRLLCLHGPATSQQIKNVLVDLRKLKGKEKSKAFSRRNMTRPFEDASSLEFFSRSNDCSVMAYASHSKKRPNNLVFTRLFDHQILDMLEMGVDGNTMRTISECSTDRKNITHIGSKPMFVFEGSAFETDEDLVLFKSLIVDIFQGEEMLKINLVSLDHVIVCTATEDHKVYFRHYAVRFVRNGESRIPKVDLQEVGPRLDFTMRRRVSAPQEVQAQAHIFAKNPQRPGSSKRKNVERGLMGDKVGRLHMERQNLNEIANTGMKIGKKTAAKRKAKEDQEEYVAQQNELRLEKEAQRDALGLPASSTSSSSKKKHKKQRTQ